MAVWMVRIVPGDNPGDPVKFVPELQGPGSLQVSKGDLVSWFNATNDAHQPWAAHSDFTPLPDNEVLPRQSAYYLSDVIAADASSRPSWKALAPKASMGGDGKTFFYCCKLHPNERGTIIVT
jgi:plastocyanin